MHLRRYSSNLVAAVAVVVAVEGRSALARVLPHLVAKAEAAVQQQSACAKCHLRK